MQTGDGRIPSPAGEAQYRARLILWLVMALSTVMYFVVMRLVTPANPQENPTLVTALLIVAFALVVASFVIEKLLLARMNNVDIAARRRQADIIALVFCEAAALDGLVTWFITGWSRSYVFLVLGLAGILLHHPKRES
jgi:hypothetical protein